MQCSATAVVLYIFFERKKKKKKNGWSLKRSGGANTVAEAAAPAAYAPRIGFIFLRRAEGDKKSNHNQDA